MTEMWLIEQSDRTSGFSYVLNSQSFDISAFSMDLENMGYRSVATVSNSMSRYLTRDDCAISMHLCESDEETFAGGVITPQLSKRMLIGKIAMATLLIGVALIFMMLAVVFILVGGSLLAALGFLELAQLIGGMFFPALNLTIIIGVLITPFVGAIFIIPNPAKKMLAQFKKDLKEVVRNQIEYISIHEFQIRPEPKAAKLDPDIFRKLEVIRNLEPADTYNRILDYITQY
ncbi:MAG: hypothetical protein ACFFDR_08290 [Candidatus Thorarchaeota archaeon]